MSSNAVDCCYLLLLLLLFFYLIFHVIFTPPSPPLPPSISIFLSVLAHQSVAQDNSTDEIEYTDTERGRNSKPTNQSCDSFLISMDSILMCSTGLVCIIIYGIVQGCIYRDYPDGVWPVDIPGSNFADDSLLEDIEYNGLE